MTVESLDYQALLKNALLKVKEMKAKLEAVEHKHKEPLAVVGMACRYPGADTPEDFWKLLQNGVDRVTAIPIGRWSIDDYYDPVPGTPGKFYVREAAFLDRIDEFDPQFFGISPREAIYMDPQHRLLLEICWEALERAGQAPAALKNSKTGIFVGVSASEYLALVDEAIRHDTYISTGNSAIFASGRLSYVLGLQGPNLVIDTACSASLIGVHLACESLRNGSSDLALAGGVHLLLDVQSHVSMSQMGALAADGRCKTFDAAANGYGRGEGCGMIVLKRLAEAEADHDNILAVIRGSATNHDGASSGLTVPSAAAQIALIRQALANGQVNAQDVDYVEAHGTGTALGDPIEIHALAGVFGKRTTPLLVGSVKTNFGHLEEAAGIAGLMKVILAMQHGEIPQHLHFSYPNPHIDWEHSAIRVPIVQTPWPSSMPGEPHPHKRIAGVSSFGMGGSNAHVIVEEAPPLSISPQTEGRERGNDRPWHLLTLSAKSERALQALVQRYSDFLQQCPTIDLADLCYTAYTGRNHFPHRLSVAASSVSQLQAELAAYAAGQAEAGTRQATLPAHQPMPKLAFLFTGQGAQYVGMGRALYATSPVFRTVIDRCDEVVQECMGRSLLELLYPSTPPNHNDLLESHPCGQAANFALECALVELWRSWGIEPDIVLGHSLGDFAAAYTAGVFSLEDGLRLVIERGRLMAPAIGAMVWVMAPESAVAPFLRQFDDVVVAVIGGPKNVVISGGEANVATAAKQLYDAGFTLRHLGISVAAHSPLLDPILPTFEMAVRQVTLAAPQCPVVSSMTGQVVTTELADPIYWRQHLRNPVRFADGVQTLYEQGCTVFLEIGPKPTLLWMAEQIYGQMNKEKPRPVMLPSLRENINDWQQILTTLGELYVCGVKLHWQGFDKGYSRRKVVLPTYPFQRERYWLHPQERATNGTGAKNALAHLLDANTLHDLLTSVTEKGNFGEAEQETVSKVLSLLTAESYARKSANPRVDSLHPPHLTNGEAPQPTPQAAKMPLRQTWEALSGNQRLEAVCMYIEQTLSRILGLTSPPDRAIGFTELGMDSFMSLELRRAIEGELHCTLPATMAFEYPTVTALATYLLHDVLALAEPQNLAEATPPQRLSRGIDEPIAIISMACRFPGADTPEAYWELLKNGADMVREIPMVRWNADNYYDPQRPTSGKMYMREGAFIDNIEQFDPLFFGISPREAVGMDPQQRLLLETSWEVLERAGLNAEQLIASQTGVFIGITGEEYGDWQDAETIQNLNLHAVTSSGNSIAAGRIAYLLGLQGPALAVDTACSSSLVAIHLACQSLRTGECDLALAGGVSLMLSPVTFIALSQMQALSPNGRCKTFDTTADGYGRGEGCGLILLKRLSDAIEDGDPVLAVINGSAINHDGPSSGLTVPNRHAQEKVIRQALKNARFEPARVAYIEAHGTGTPLGDPIELRALHQVFGDRPTPLVIGSVKTNIGHLEAAAGIAGIIKVALSLQHGAIPAHLHLQHPTEHVDWQKMPLIIPTTGMAWPAGERVAGISSFGMSGTNCHIILSAAPETGAAVVEQAADGDTPAVQTPQLLTLSAKSAKALQEMAARYLAYLDLHPEATLRDICFTANTGRKAFKQRLAVVAASREQLSQQLTAFTQGQPLPPTTVVGVADPKPKRIAFLFTGQGAQYVGMGRTLYAAQPVFREAIDRCQALLQPYLDRNLLELLFPPGHEATSAAHLLDQTIYTQPALFALEYALAELWKSWGIEPDIVLGHSVGEYVAACVAGVFSLEDGLKLIAARGRLMQALPSDGQMVAVKASYARLAPFLEPYADTVSIAAVNGPEATVISGKRVELEAICEQFISAGIQTKTLAVSHAFHSPLMKPILTDFAQVANEVTFFEPRIPLISNVLGTAVNQEVTTATYWCDHILAPVLFAKSMAYLQEQAVTHCLEIGPKPILLGMAHECLSDDAAITLLPTIRPEQEWEQWLKSLGALYVQGVPLAWSRFYQPAHHRRLTLPTYPFQRQRYWKERSHFTQNGTAHTNGATHRNADSASLLSVIEPSAPKTFRLQLEERAVAEWPAQLLAFVAAEVSAIINFPAGEQLDLAASFLELGVDSLMAYELRSRLQTQLDCTLPSTLLFAYPTVTDLANYLAKLVIASAHDSAISSGSSHALVLDRENNNVPSTVVPIQPNGLQPPLFMVSAILGSAFDLQRLAYHLGTEQPFYGLRSLGLDEENNPFTRVEEIAAHHIQSLQAVQPVGPYQLGGYSFGGKVAYEMAQQLQQQGHEVSLLVMLDTPRWAVGESAQATAWDEAQFVLSFAELYSTFSHQTIEEPLEWTVDFVRSLTSAEQLKFLRARVKNAGIDLTEVELQRAVCVYQANLLAHITYQPQATAPCPITLLRAQELMAFDLLPTVAMTAEDPTWGWQPLANEPIDYQLVPGNHMTMIEEPHVRLLAEQLRTYLSQKATDKILP